MAVRLPRSPENRYETATLNSPTPALPASMFLRSKIEESSTPVYLGGFATGSSGNFTGFYPTGNTSGPGNFQATIGHSTNNSLINSGVVSDQLWNAHFCSLVSNANGRYRVNGTEVSSTFGTGDWHLGVTAVMGGGGGWLTSFVHGDSSAHALALWNIELSTAEKDQLEKVNNPMMVRPDALTHYWLVDGQVPRTLFGGQDMVQTGSADTHVDSPVMKRKF